MFCKKGVLKNFQNSQENTCASLFFSIIAGFRPVTLLKKETLAQVFSYEFCEISKDTFFTEQVWWLLLIKKEITPFIALKAFIEYTN